VAELSNKAENLSETFLGDVFRYFGVRSSSLVLLTGVVISSLGLGTFINPTFCLVASYAGMLIAYSLRTYVWPRYIRTLVGCLVFSSILVGAFLLADRQPAIADFIRTTPTAWQFITTLAFFLFSIQFCVCLISYRRLAETIPSDLPPPIIEVLRAAVHDAPLFYKLVKYELKIHDQQGQQGFACNYVVTLEYKNRAARTTSFPSRYHTQKGKFELGSIRINGEPRDIEDPSLKKGNGIEVEVVIPPEKSTTVEVAINTVVADMGNDLFTCFDYPAERFDITVTDLTQGSVAFWIEPLHSQKRECGREKNVLDWRSQMGLLPNQGVRVHWERRDGRARS
jgi:hypothetical protein